MSSFRIIEDSHGGTILAGELYAPDAGPRPTVLVFPTVAGIADHERAVAARLNALGYAAFICDLYGRDAPRETREQCFALMDALRADRGFLQDRMLALLASVRAQPEVDAARIAAIGYCFGGQCVLDLARTGADIRAAASFHGLFDPPGNRDGVPIRARVAAYHGWDDPMVPPEAVTALAAELTEAGADWQIHAYGHTTHGFTNVKAPGTAQVAYNETADRRSWASLVTFLDEALRDDTLLTEIGA